MNINYKATTKSMKDALQSELPKRIAKLRESSGVTLEALCSEFPSYKDWESGAIVLKTASAIALAQYYEIGLDELLFGEPSQSPLISLMLEYNQNKTIGDRIRAVRALSGQSQNSIGYFLGMSENYLSASERNLQIPSILVLYYLCSHYRVSPHWIVFGGDPFRKDVLEIGYYDHARLLFRFVLAYFLEDLGLTVKQFCKEVGVATTTGYGWLAGKSLPGNLKTYNRIFKALDADLSLFSWLSFAATNVDAEQVRDEPDVAFEKLRTIAVSMSLQTIYDETFNDVNSSAIDLTFDHDKDDEEEISEQAGVDKVTDKSWLERHLRRQHNEYKVYAEAEQSPISSKGTKPEAQVESETQPQAGEQSPDLRPMPEPTNDDVIHEPTMIAKGEELLKSMGDIIEKNKRRKAAASENLSEFENLILSMVLSKTDWRAVASSGLLPLRGEQEVEYFLSTLERLKCLLSK